MEGFSFGATIWPCGQQMPVNIGRMGDIKGEESTEIYK
jgi:hypothetical protein